MRIRHLQWRWPTSGAFRQFQFHECTDLADRVNYKKLNAPIFMARMLS
jgi:hypothetical protein